MRIAVCMKWVDTRPEIDPLSGAVTVDERWFAASPSDQAALETALRLVDERGGEVTAVCAGPAGAASMLRDALAAGATRAVRVDVDPSLDAAAVAEAVAPVVLDTDLVCCGTWSLDRGTGSFPAFLAHRLGVAQALGCTFVRALDDDLAAERRLDGGRRERLRLRGRSVVSVEAGIELRRAPLPAVLLAAEAVIGVVEPDPPPPSLSRLERVGPYRPRSRELEAPTGDDTRQRLLALTGAVADDTRRPALRLDAEAAAGHLLAALGERGIGPEAAGSQ